MKQKGSMHSINTICLGSHTWLRAHCFFSIFEYIICLNISNMYRKIIPIDKTVIEHNVLPYISHY